MGFESKSHLIEIQKEKIKSLRKDIEIESKFMPNQIQTTQTKW